MSWPELLKYFNWLELARVTGNHAKTNFIEISKYQQFKCREGGFKTVL